ncbi:MAG TPA: nitroreductase family protein [Flavobacteriia bacterium]|nr:nitroreductase family protein [Flavobacteriia bacterium]
MSKKKTITINGFTHIAFPFTKLSESESLKKSMEFYQFLNDRRSIREFSNKPIPKKIIENILLSASTAPSGAHKQPWTFCVVSNLEIKSKIRKAAEKEEQESYANRMSERWKKDLAHLGTDANKPFLEEAPYLIIVFKKVYELDKNGKKHNNYYVNESVGIACGMLITAIHHAGMVTLTHTPSPMNFLSKILNRPSNERPFLLLPVGYPKEPIYVPNLKRKQLDAISEFYE